jgi:hypothetical protein
MARTYTTSTLLDSGQLKESDINSETQGFIQEFNGQFDQHQLPLQAFQHTHLAQPTVSTTFAASNGTYSSYMTSQSYHASEWVVTAVDPAMRADNVLYPGFTWIKLQALQLQSTGMVANATGGAELNFDALEGMLIGNAVIDFNWFSGEAVSAVDGSAGVSTNYGSGSVIEWGVFVDDVLVSKSGFIWPRRLTLNLPFNAPISSKPVIVDIRFRAQFIDPEASTTPTGIVISTQIDRYQELKYMGGQLWTRNQYR